MRFLQTLTARVIIGSLILAATAAGLSIATTANQNRLNQEIRVIRTGYLRLTLRTRDLSEKQKALVDYVRNDLVGESNIRRVDSRIRRSRDTRDRLLAEIDAALADQTDAPSTHERRLKESRDRLEGVRKLVDETAPYYEALLKAPPIERVNSSDPIAPVSSEDVAAAEEALIALTRIEGRIAGKTSELARYHQRLVEVIAKGLEKGSSELRKYSIMFLVAAVVVGLAVVLWTGLTLGPLRRLPSAAKRIAEGDYAARIPEGGPTEVAVLAHEFNQMASAIEGRERELVRSERLATVGKMAAMITHEVRNPLSAIGLNTELLEEELGELGEGTLEARSLCTAINKEVDRLTEITETYLQFARLPQPRLHPEDVGELVRNLTTFVGEEMSKKNIKLTTTIGDDLPQIELDHAQIKQGLLNLIRNAAEALTNERADAQAASKAREARDEGDEGDEGDEENAPATSKQPELRVVVSAKDDVVHIEVSDNGPGIPADVLPRLFEPFFTTKQSGTGLGLALTQQIVREHGGSLAVESKTGQGARFVLTLPVVSGPSVLAD